MQDSLENLYQCFLWASQFAQSCAVYQKVAEEAKDRKSANMFGALAVEYSQEARNLLGLFQEAKDVSFGDDSEIASEVGVFLGISDTPENIARANKNLSQFTEEYLPECADICAQEGLITISTELWEIEKRAKKNLSNMG